MKILPCFDDIMAVQTYGEKQVVGGGLNIKIGKIIILVSRMKI